MHPAAPDEVRALARLAFEELPRGVGVSLIAELGLTTIRDDILVRDLGRDTPVRNIYAAVSGGYRTPATTAMLEVLTNVAAGYESRRPRLSLVG